MLKIRASMDILRARRAMDNAADFTQPYKEVSRFVVEEIRRGLDTQGVSLGTPFAPNKPGWRAEKARRGWSTKIMTATGKLRRSISNIDVQVAKRDLVLRFKSPAARTQYGTKNMPPRVWFTFSPAATAALLEAVKKHVQDEFDRA